MNSGINAKYATPLAFQTFFVKKILKYFFRNTQLFIFVVNKNQQHL